MTQASRRRDKRGPIESTTLVQVQGQRGGGCRSPLQVPNGPEGLGKTEDPSVGLLPTAVGCWGRAGPLPAASWMHHGLSSPAPMGPLLPLAQGVNRARSRTVTANPATQAPKHNTQNYGLILQGKDKGWLNSEFHAAAEGLRERRLRSSLNLPHGSF